MELTCVKMEQVEVKIEFNCSQMLEEYKNKNYDSKTRTTFTIYNSRI